MGAQNLAGRILDPERVLHVACRMIFGNVQSSEVVPVVLELGACGDAKAHTAKNIRDLADSNRHRVQPTGSSGRIH